MTCCHDLLQMGDTRTYLMCGRPCVQQSQWQETHGTGACICCSTQQLPVWPPPAAPELLPAANRLSSRSPPSPRLFLLGWDHRLPGPPPAGVAAPLLRLLLPTWGKSRAWRDVVSTRAREVTRCKCCSAAADLVLVCGWMLPTAAASIPQNNSSSTQLDVAPPSPRTPLTILVHRRWSCQAGTGTVATSCTRSHPPTWVASK